VTFTPPVSEELKTKQLLPVSLILTIYNEERSLATFLSSILAMTTLPAEMVIVDGGSTDASVEILEAFRQSVTDIFTVTIIADPTCSLRFSSSPIAKGRNAAIRQAQYGIIAATDAGCVVAPEWLDEITRPMLEGPEIQMVGGWYQPLATTFFERCQALVVIPPLSSVNRETFLPSSRSVAFRRSLWETVGGYPEVSYTAEDTLFDLQVRRVTGAVVFADRAVVFWRMRPSIGVFLRMNYRYGFGEGHSRIPVWTVLFAAVKITIAVLLFLAGWLFHWSGFAAAVVYLWLLPFTKDIRSAFKAEHSLKYPVTALLKMLVTAVYIAGYLRGRISDTQPSFKKIQDSIT
jgi:glycosyltransferase involved in cell wall biosynthesis